ncbi:MAG: tetratricopeptide repeat protein [Chloroflexi bacterium]|nr:tetratricopeptide repeat protein [Chloroflexota bacterium]
MIPSDTLPPTTTPTLTPTPEARIENGDLALFNGDFALAQTEYQAAFASTNDPSLQAAALWGLGQADMQAGNSGGALDDFNQLIANYADSPHRAQAHFLRGEILMGLERYIESVEAYSAYLTLRSGVIDYYIFERRGDAYAALGDYTDAIGDYQSALNSAHIGDDSSLQVKLARAYESAGDAVTALGMYDAIAAASSNDYLKAQMDLYAGQLHLSLGQPDEAYARFLHSVENYPLAYDSYSALVALVQAGVPVDDLNRGLVDYFAGQYGYALDAFTRYAAAYPENDGTVYYYRALALRDTGLYQDAVDTFSYFIANYSDNRYWQAAWEEKAYTQWAYLDQYEAAAQTFIDFTHSTSDLSAIPQALLNAGRIYERAGLLDQAAATWESIADTHPGSELVPQALFWAGIVRYRSGQYEQALVTFQRGVLFSLTPEDQARAIFWTGKTQQILGDADGAQASFQQAASLNQTDYYSLRAQDILFNRAPFDSPPSYAPEADLAAERLNADAWLRVTFGLPTDTDLSDPGALISDARLIRGTELWGLGLQDDARLEFEDLRAAVSENAADSYRLGNYLLDLGLYRPAIFAIRQVLTLAGMDEQSETLAAPRYFNLVRYGFYYPDLIFPFAEGNGFHPLFLFSVVRQESLFEGFVHSTAGARGLMQIIPDTGQFIADNYGWPPDYAAEDLYRPIVSIRLGSYYLMNNRTYFGGDLYSALAAYNAGPGNAEVWRGLSGSDPDLFVEIIRFAETRDYIRSIYEIYWMYRQLYETVP